MTHKNVNSERDIAHLAARVLHETFISASKNETVLYVEDDTLFSKSPNCNPVVIKYLTGRNPEIAKKFARRGTYKIKKQKIEITIK
ncbi:hypothetical protein ABFO60_17135 [Acinetobacter baumannii]